MATSTSASPRLPVRCPRCAIGQRFQVALGSAAGEVLQHVAARIHDRNDHACERLTQCERSGHGYKGDGIHPDPADPKVVEDGYCQGGNDGCCREAPYPAGAHRPDKQMRRGAGEQADDREGKKCAMERRFSHVSPSS